MALLCNYNHNKWIFSISEKTSQIWLESIHWTICHFVWIIWQLKRHVKVDRASPPLFTHPVSTPIIIFLICEFSSFNLCLFYIFFF